MYSTPTLLILSSRPRLVTERFRFVDEHDGDVILDRVSEPAGFAIEGFILDPVKQITPAPGTDKDLEEF